MGLITLFQLPWDMIEVLLLIVLFNLELGGMDTLQVAIGKS